MKKYVTFCILLSCMVWTVPFRAESSETKTGRPNVLFLMTDQMRADAFGADGNKVIQTPNLDRLAAEGARFRHAYSSVPSCTAARTTILTGLSPWNHGLLGYKHVGTHYEREMPRMLTEAGYRTIGVGKMHYHPQRNKHGFETVLLEESKRSDPSGLLTDYRAWFREQAPDSDPDVTGIGSNSHRAAPYALPERLHPTRWTSDRAVEFLERYEEKRPFFLKVSFTRPHSPYDPPKRYWDMYENADIPARNIGDWCERHAQRGKKHSDSLWQGDLGEQAARTARIGYYANITFVDDEIGRILKVLRDRGVLENTLILFVSDHGDMLGDHHLWRKTYAYEASARIPMIIRWGKTIPVEKRGMVLSQPVELRDLLPTFLDAAKIRYDPEWFDGRSLLNLVRDPGAPWRDAIDLEHSTCYAAENNWTGMTDGRTKYIFHATEGREQLFDLTKDPDELRDLAPIPEYRTKLEAWRQRMVDHLSERGEKYVKDGRLAVRRKGIVNSPHFPEDREP